MVRTLQDEIEEVFIRLSDRPPTAEEQALLLVDAISATMAKNPVMRVEKLDEKFIQITGAKKSEMPRTISGHLGRAGEVVIYDSVTTFIDNPQLRQKWGGTAIDITAEVLIPIDIRSQEALKRSSISMVQKESIERARNSWVSNVDSDSIADFLMANAYPLEAKSRWETKIYVSEEGTQTESRQDKRMFAKNPYIQKIAKEGGKTVVGAIAFDVVFEDIMKEQTDKIKKELKKMKSELSQKEGRLVETRVTGDVTTFFKIVSLRINAFIPAVVDDKNFRQWIRGQIIDPADRQTNMIVSEFTTEVMDRIHKSYKQSREKS